LAASAYASKASTAAFNGYASNPRGDQLGWGESYILMGMVSMFEGTGEGVHLQRAFGHADQVLANRADRINVRDDIRGRVVPAWPTGQYTDGVNYAWEVHAGMVSAPIARAAYLVRNDPALSGAHGARADRYVRDLTDMAVGFEADWKRGPGAGEGYYKEHNLTTWASPYNQMNAMGRMYVNLYLATGQARYRERAEGMARFLKNRLRLAGGGTRYDWSYAPTSPATQSEDLSHAAINADFAFECYRAGIVFDATDMQRFVGTFMKMSNGTGGYFGTVAGTGALYGTPGLAGMWGRLGYVDPRVRTEFYKYYQNNSGVGGATWGSTIAAYLVETTRPLAMNAPVARPDEFKLLAGMEPGEGRFGLGAAGTLSVGLGTGSGWRYENGVSHQERRSLRVAAVDDSSRPGGWAMEVPAGEGLTLDRAGWVGVWLRTESAGVDVALVLNDLGGTERSSLLPVVGDGAWRLYQWNLDDATHWDGLDAANGALDGLMVDVRSLLFRGGETGAVVFADELRMNLNGTVPEPGSAVVAGGAALIAAAGRRRRR
jgi:hypothetical protein